MCGRYTLTSPDELLDEFGVGELPYHFEPRYNIAPTQQAPVVLTRDGVRTIEMHRWGLVPSWAKDIRIGNKLINARSETAATKPAFRDAFKNRRCIVPSDGFFEWKKDGGRRVPYWIRPRCRRLLAMAGLWERWKAGDDWLLTFTILTGPANDAIAPLHDRMPIVIEPVDWERWLSPEPLPEQALADILAGPPELPLRIDEVSSAVNSPRNDSPACIRLGPDQPSLF